MKIAEVLFSFFLVLVSLFMFVVGLSYPYDTDFGPGPGFMPVWISGFSLVLTSILSYTLIKKEKGEDFFDSKQGVKNLVLFTLLLVASVFSIQLIGMIVGLGLFSFLVFFILEKYTIRSSLSVAIGTALVIFLIFDFWLNIPIPAGILFS